MNVLPECSGDNVLRCIFDKIDDDRNGLVTLPEFLLFAVKELKLYSLDGDQLREKVSYEVYIEVNNVVVIVVMLLLLVSSVKVFLSVFLSSDACRLLC